MSSEFVQEVHECTPAGKILHGSAYNCLKIYKVNKRRRINETKVQMPKRPIDSHQQTHHPWTKRNEAGGVCCTLADGQQ